MLFIIPPLPSPVLHCCRAAAAAAAVAAAAAAAADTAAVFRIPQFRYNYQALQTVRFVSGIRVIEGQPHDTHDNSGSCLSPIVATATSIARRRGLAVGRGIHSRVRRNHPVCMRKPSLLSRWCRQALGLAVGVSSWKAVALGI